MAFVSVISNDFIWYNNLYIIMKTSELPPNQGGIPLHIFIYNYDAYKHIKTQI